MSAPRRAGSWPLHRKWRRPVSTLTLAQGWQGSTQSAVSPLGLPCRDVLEVSSIQIEANKLQNHIWSRHLVHSIEHLSTSAWQGGHIAHCFKRKTTFYILQCRTSNYRSDEVARASTVSALTLGHARRGLRVPHAAHVAASFPKLVVRGCTLTSCQTVTAPTYPNTTLPAQSRLHDTVRLYRTSRNPPQTCIWHLP